MWKRWRTKYVRALRERHDITQKKQYYPQLGCVGRFRQQEQA